MHDLDLGTLVAWRRVIVLVQVDLAQQQDILAADEERTARDISVET